MNWFRKHLKHGSRLALFALAIQFALSFGHFHGEIARAAPAIQTGLADADLAIAATLVAPLSEAAQQPSGPDTDRHSSDCAICAVLSLANNFMFATPPLLELPSGAIDEQTIALRDAMRVLFPEAVALVSAARQGFMQER